MIPQSCRIAFLLLLTCAPLTAQPVRLSIPAFGQTAEVEVRDLRQDLATSAAKEALAEIHRVALAADPDSQRAGSLGALNQAAGSEGLAVDETAADLLVHSLQFCIWSRGIYGPLGGELRQFWRQRQPGGNDDAQSFSRALASANCDNLRAPANRDSIWTLAKGSRIEVPELATGFAVDQAAELLESQGITNAWVQIGDIQRAIGDGPSGEGWPVELPTFPGTEEPLDDIWLRDQSLVIARHVEGHYAEGHYIDQRNGRLASGTVALVVVSERAADTAGLAATLFAAGHRLGQRQLGALSPRPSVIWLLGQGEGRPLQATYRWSEIRQRH